VYEKRIEIRWRDLDSLGHVNNAVYLTYLEEVRDEWLQHTVGGGWEYLLARIAIDYRSELTQADDIVLARIGVLAVGTRSVRTREELRKLDGTLVAEAETVFVLRDAENRGSRPLAEAERAALERELVGPA